jgi:hypothetical protein
MNWMFKHITYGLNSAFYFRYLVIGLLLLAWPITVYFANNMPLAFQPFILDVTNTLLFPLSFFLLKRTYEVFVTDKPFSGSPVFLTAVKMCLMLFCWLWAFLLVPLLLIALLYKVSSFRLGN